MYVYMYSCRDSVVSIVTRCGAGGAGDRIAVGARFSVPVQTDPGADLASCRMGTGSLFRGLSGRGVALTIHPHLAPRLKKE
jgi:hypothetical protein